MKRPIAISLSPNLESDDFFLALKLLLSPIRWFDIGYTRELEEKFAAYFGKGYKALAVTGGRSALYLILKSLGMRYPDEVALQAFTCSAVPNPVKWAGGNPVYVDINKDFNMDPKDLKKKLSKNTKVVIVQHSFGIPADIKNIRKHLKKQTILIEDCAVSLGATIGRQKVGTMSDISFFSFGRDKIISSVFGGVILVKDSALYEKLFKARSILGYPNFLWVIRALLHPVIFFMALPVYNFGVGKITLGKIIIQLVLSLKLIDRPISSSEMKSEKPTIYPTKMPGALSALALKQFSKLERFNSRRIKIAAIYQKLLRNSRFVLPSNQAGAVWLRYPVLHEDAPNILKHFKKKGILLGDWYKKPVYPINENLYVNYRSGTCPTAEECSKKTINLPTYPTMTDKQVDLICNLLSKWK